MHLLLVFVCIVAGTYSHPTWDYVLRSPRSAGYSSAGSSASAGAFAGASAGAGAISSAGTSALPATGGSNFGYSGSTNGVGYNGIGNYAGGGTGTFTGPGGAFVSAGGLPYTFANSNAPPFFPYPQFDFFSFMRRYFQSASAQQQAVSNSQGTYGSSGASAYGQYSPTGGYGSANIYPPPAGGIDVRMGGAQDRNGPVGSVSASFPPPSDGYYGISSFSSSAQSDNNGLKNSYRTSSVSVNDNGKVTTYTAHDP